MIGIGSTWAGGCFSDGAPTFAPAETPGPREPSGVLLYLELSDTGGRASDRLAAAIRATAKDGLVGAIQGTLRFDASRLRYAGQDDGATSVLVVNADSAEAGRLDLLALDTPAPSLRSAALAFDVLADGGPGSLRFELLEAALDDGSTLAATEGPRPVMIRGLAVPRAPVILPRSAWLGPAGDTRPLFNATDTPFPPNLRFGDVTLDGRITVADAAYTAMMALGLVPLADSPDPWSRPGPVAANVSPANLPGVGGASDPLAPGVGADGLRRITAADALTIARAAVGAPIPVVGEVVPPQPAPSSRTTELLVHRLDAARGETTVSSGIPLPAGFLRAADLPQVRLVAGGAERPIYLEALRGTHRDGSLRAVLVQFRADVSPGAPLRAVLESGATPGTSRRAKVPVTWTRPPAVALPASPDYLVATGIVGPTITAARAAAAAEPIRVHDERFAALSAEQWEANGTEWSVMNYYDRALNHYAAWARTGDVRYWRRATDFAVDYRTGYLEPNNNATSPHWAQLEGLALHYWLTGDDRSRQAAIGSAHTLVHSFPVASMARFDYRWNEGRIQQRVLLSALLAWELGDRSLAWDLLATGYVNGILGLQRADGSYDWPNECGRQANFMVGLQSDALIKYYERYRADPRIPASVKRAADYLWVTQWRPSAEAFAYYDGYCAGHGDTSPAPDLNHLIGPSFAWYYKVSRDGTYRARADAIFAAGVRRAFYQDTKQFNQQYYNSFNYLAYRE